MKLPVLSEQGRWMLKGAGYALAAMVIVVLGLGGWVVYVRSLHGQMAYEYIQAAIAQQAESQKGHPSPPPAK